MDDSIIVPIKSYSFTRWPPAARAQIAIASAPERGQKTGMGCSSRLSAGPPDSDMTGLDRASPVRRGPASGRGKE